MNPFSGFLQPPTQRSPLAGAAEFVNDLSRLQLSRQQEANRVREFGLDNARADRYANLAEAQQRNTFSQQDQKQVESLLAEYQDAEDQGDPVRLERAAQMLKRFGMDVKQGAPPSLPGQLPSPAALQALTGQSAKPDLQALTGQPLDPNDPVQVELRSRAALRAKNSQPEQDLSQQDFEEQLINSTQVRPSRYERNGETTAEFKAMLPGMLPQVDEATEPSEVIDLDSPEVKAAAASEGETTRLSPAQEAEFQAWAKRNGIRDANSPEAHYDYRGYFIQSGGAPHRAGDHFPDTFKQHGHETFSEESTYSRGRGDGGTWDGERFKPGRPELANTTTNPPPLPGMLPTVVSRNGKELYRSTGPSGRRSAMVQNVFAPFVAHENPQISEAAKSAQAYAEKLINVDGMSPQDAIKAAADQMNKTASLTVGLERTKLGSRPRGVGGGSAVGDVPLTGKELAALGDDAQQLMLSITAKPEYQKVSVMDDVLNGAESALQSNDPVRQQQAISDIMRARSGLTVRKDEEASLQNAQGLWEGLRARLSQKAGYGLTEDFRNSLAKAITAQRAINQQIRRRIAEETRQFYLTTRTTSDHDTGSRAEQVRRNSGAIEGMLKRGGANPQETDNSDLYE